MVCPSCDTQNRDDAKFCKKCGHPFHTEASAAIEVTAAPEANRAPASAPSNTGPANVVEDISLAPTQILTGEQMMAYHRRRWEREAEAEQNAASAMPSANGDVKAAQSEPSAAPAAGEMRPGNVSNVGKTGEQENLDIADMPTMLINPTQNEEAGTAPQTPLPSVQNDQPIPPPPPHIVFGQEEKNAEDTGITDSESNQPTVQADASREKNGNEATMASGSEEKENMPETTAGQSTESSESTGSNAEETPSTGGDFAVLAVGTLLDGRYEVTEVVSDDAQSHVYAVVDHQGYQHCWNCGTEENSEGDEFCNDCGAELLNIPYVMHEYPASVAGGQGEPGEKSAEASVLQGNIVNTFVDAGKTYAIEQEQVEQNAFPNGVHLAAASDSDAGDVRRSDPNEDSTLVLQMQRIHESVSVPMGVFIVADGMGGHDNGQLASRVAINIIAERMVRELLNAPLTQEKSGQPVQLADEEAMVALLQGTIEDANAAICAVNQREKTDMGSTITGFMIVGEHAYILNVGDSRTYMVRGGQIYQLTNDHSLVGQLVAGGLIQPDDVYTHPQRNQIFRSLGDKLNVQVDIFKQQLHPGDVLLSCCDGLWEMIRNPQIESILNTASGPQMACTQLVETANTNGGEDNISVVVVYVS
ncbi:MAG TPA: protein phosphatase 2C domain-containing protein [Ktedonobacteraceae bacterium]|nr:protein phosphatase 2C domain-containing protein [Ktedonobacteraceae bacterium]